ncbi:MAG: STAS domain-containing protein [Planctomycetota bacterium]
MEVTREERNGGILLDVAGNVDIYTSPELRGELKAAIDAKCPRIVVDMARVTFVDSSGLATLIEGLQRVKTFNGRLVLCALPKTVLGVFQLSNLDTLFEIAPDRDAAFAA